MRPLRPRLLRTALLVLLLLSAAGGLLVQPRVVAAVRADTLDAMWLIAAPAIFALVVVLAAIDTWRAARREGFFRGPRMLVVAICVAFLGLLVPSTFSEYRARTYPPAADARMAALIKHKDPRVRAVVMDAVGWRPGPPEEVAALLVIGLDDKDPLVSDAAVQAVAHKAGEVLTGDAGRTRARELLATWSR